nr:putative amino acid transporter minor isoform [Bombyx mori]
MNGNCTPETPLEESQTKPLVVSSHDRYTVGETTGGLSVLFTILCIVDLFGVFPVIALPKSVISCGIYGIPLVLSVVGLQLYTAALLGRCWLLAKEITPIISEKNRSPYAAVAQLAFGDPARRLVIFLIDATVFGSGVPNFILAAQSLQIFWWKISGGNVGVTYCIWMIVLALLLCPIMWLGSPKDMKPLALTSVFIVTTVAVSTWTCIIQDDVSPVSTGTILEYQPHAPDFLIAYGILAFQFDIHPMLLTIQVDMRDSKKVNKAVLGGFAITGFMFTTTAFLVATRYGQDVTNNILQTIPPSIPLYLVALLVTLQLCLSSAVSNSALFQHIEDLLQIPRNFCIQRCLIRSSVVAVAVFLAETVPRFDLVMGLVGSTLTGPLMFIFPPLFFLKLCYLKSKKDITESQNAYSNNATNGSLDSQKSKLNKIETSGSSHQNGVVTVIQNGENVNPSLYTKYKTFSRDYAEMGKEDEYTIKWYDIVLALVVMTLGIAATVIATYCSWAHSIEYAEFSPPCLLNATIAARSFLESQMAL